MRVHVLQHVPFEGPGSIAAWLTARQEVVTTTRLFEAGAVLPPLSAFDVLIVLGGPMSANDEAALPWLRPEKRLLRKAIRSGKAVLGVCLWAQLMAAALGARVYPAQHKEIGWFPIQGCAPQGSGFAFPATAEVFHWHGETFDLPDGGQGAGEAVDVDEEGRLVVRTDSGEVHVFTGEVSVHGIYGAV